MQDPGDFRFRASLEGRKGKRCGRMGAECGDAMEELSDRERQSLDILSVKTRQDKTRQDKRLLKLWQPRSWTGKT